MSDNIFSILGHTPAEATASTHFWSANIHPDDLCLLRGQKVKLVPGEKQVIEYRFRHKNGSYHWLRDEFRLILSPCGTPLELVGCWIDISGQKQMEATCRHQTFHDALTGLPNRLLFNDHLKLALALANRNGHQLAVMFLDLDRFKTINDSLGHTAGDQLLQTIAFRLTAELRDGDTAARTGGDEYTVLLPVINHERDAAGVASKLICAVSHPLCINGHELQVTTSIGISLYPSDGSKCEELLKHADTAMYHAKEHGRNTYQFYNPTMNVAAYDRMVLETGLRRAIAREEFVVHYQPLIDIASWQITGLEALVRWQHPERGQLSPMQFIPLAEETGLIVPLGEWVLQTACRQSRAWRQAGLTPPRLKVNLSARQFQQPNLVETVSAILQDAQLEPTELELEITESVAMANLDQTIHKLKQMNSMGIQFAIDDFGTGYSSLNYLKKLPINTLKIDQTFMRDLSSDTDDAAIVSAVIVMAHSLKLKVVAEGVENKDQLMFLNEKKCDEMQGFLFSRPLPADQFEQYFLISPAHQRNISA